MTENDVSERFSLFHAVAQIETEAANVILVTVYGTSVYFLSECGFYHTESVTKLSLILGGPALVIYMPSNMTTTDSCLFEPRGLHLAMTES